MNLFFLVSMLAQTSVGAAAPGQQTPISTTVQWLAKTVVTTLACPAQLESGTTGTCTVALNQAAPSPKTIALTSDDTTKITVPASITIATGQTTGTFVITAQ